MPSASPRARPASPWVELTWGSVVVGGGLDVVSGLPHRRPRGGGRSARPARPATRPEQSARPRFRRVPRAARAASPPDRGCSATRPRVPSGRPLVVGGVGCHALVPTQELVEECAEVDHRLAQVFGAGVALRGTTEMPCAARWCSTTTGWVDGHVCSALLEVLGDGITELAHDRRDERNRPRPLRAQADRRRSAAPWPSARRSARAPRVPVRGSRASRVGCARPVRIPPRATAGRNSAVGRPAPAVEA
jgi:hypothetical protein